MPARPLARESWHTFFETLTRTLQDSREADVEVASLDLGDQTLARRVRLHGLSYDARDDLFEVELENVGHRVVRPTAVSVDWEGDGMIGVEIVGGDGARTILRLREPLLLPAPAQG